jgi:hypothetical protein
LKQSYSVTAVMVFLCVTAGIIVGPNAALAQPTETYDNGPLVTHPGGGCSGNDASRLQEALGMDVMGFIASRFSGYHVVDNFTVPAPGWIVSTITFFTYSDPVGIPTDVRVRIWNGAPNAGGSVIWGNTTTNRFLSSSFTGIYRDNENLWLGNCDRPIRATVAAIEVVLTPGTYWVDFQIDTTPLRNVYAPPTTVIGSTSPCSPCNALQWNTSTWVAVTDSGTLTPQDVKFVISYEWIGQLFTDGFETGNTSRWSETVL